MAGESTWVNGQSTAAISVRDRGLQFGDGLFETMAVRGGTVLHWQRHRSRLLAGCERLGLDVDPQLLQAHLAQAVGGCERAILKLIVTRGDSLQGYALPPAGRPNEILVRRDWPDALLRFSTRGLRLRWCHHRLSSQPALAGLKHLNRLDQVLARSEWSEPDIDEGLMRDQSDRVVEGVSSNLFLVADGGLITPGLDNCGVRGVMRDLVLEIAGAQGLPTQERPVTADEVRGADELFMTNSLMGIRPVTRLAEQTYPVGPVTRALLAGARDSSDAD